MAHLVAEFYFGLTGLAVESAIRGQTLAFKRGEFDFELWSPATADGFSPEGSFEKLLIELGLGMGTLPVVRLRLRFTDAVSNAVFEADEAVAKARGLAALDRAFREASALLTELIQWTRIRGQVWLDPHPDSLQLFQPATLMDADANKVLPITLSTPTRVPKTPSTGAVDVSFFAGIPLLVGDGRPTLPLAETLYADARQLANEDPPDLDKAVLIAAIACEAKVKQTLRGYSIPELSPMVDLFLNNPRDWSVAAVRLFTDVMKAAVGRSLNDDNHDLFKRLERLFAYRNTIAHAKNKRPTDIELKDAIGAAGLALEWLGEVQSSQRFDPVPNTGA